MRLSASRWKPIESLDSTCIRTWGDLRASLQELVGYHGKTNIARLVSRQLLKVPGLSIELGGSSRLGVVHLFILYRDEELVLIKVWKVSWSLLLSESSVPSSTLLNAYRLQAWEMSAYALYLHALSHVTPHISNAEVHQWCPATPRPHSKVRDS